jgi:hypothetical protein
MLHAGQYQSQHVEIPLDHDDRFFFPDRALGLVQVVELSSLVEDLRLR